MIRGIIFDCFGVLHLDTNAAYFARFPGHEEELHDLNTRADHGFVDKADYLTEAATIIGTTEREVAEGIATESTLNEPLAKYIEQKLRPHYKIALLSNIGRGWVKDFFDTHQLHGLFDEVVLSNEEGITKPNPLVFQHTADKLGLSPDECVMIDDREENCEGAKAAGMTALSYTSNDTLYRDLTALLSRKGEL